MTTYEPITTPSARGRGHATRRALALVLLTALVGVLGASTAGAGTEPGPIDDLAPAGSSGPSVDGTTEFTVDRPLGAGVRVQLTQWFYRGRLIAQEQIWYVDLDGNGELNRGDRIMQIRR